MASTMLGPGARMDDEERKMIEEPMERIMERLDPGTSAMLEKWTDPVLLAFGFVTWGVRVWAEISLGDDDDGSGPGFDTVDRPGPRGPNGREVIIPEPEPEEITGSPDEQLLGQINSGQIGRELEPDA
jgi:hypothetical protein